MPDSRGAAGGVPPVECRAPLQTVWQEPPMVLCASWQSRLGASAPQAACVLRGVLPMEMAAPWGRKAPCHPEGRTGAGGDARARLLPAVPRSGRPDTGPPQAEEDDRLGPPLQEVSQSYKRPSGGACQPGVGV